MKYARIESTIDFKFSVVNHSAPRLSGVPNSFKKEYQSHLIDVYPPVSIPVNRIQKKVNEKYSETAYTLYLQETQGLVFVENPYDENSSDVNKKRNVHFKLLKEGDLVPVEYMLWRFVYGYYNEIIEGKMWFYVTFENAGLHQWLLQAIYNDQQDKASKLPKGLVGSLYQAFNGNKELISVPTKVADATVTIYNPITANKDKILAQKAELEAKAKELEKLLTETVRPTVVKPGAEEFPLPEEKTEAAVSKKK